MNALTPTQSLQSIADLVDDGTADGRNMLWRRKRWARRWDSFVELSAYVTAFAMVMAVLGGCAWIVWEVLASAWSAVTYIFS